MASLITAVMRVLTGSPVVPFGGESAATVGATASSVAPV